MTTAEVLQDRGVSLSMESIYRGLKDAAIPGRMAILRHRATLLVDGARNPAGAKAPAHSIQAVMSYRRLLMVLGMLDRHPIEGVSAALCHMADMVWATAPHHVKASALATIAQAARLHCADVRIEPGVVDAVHAALRQAQPEH
ncbi:MAG: hypothetical protein IT210_08345 [Armatimonadetes bacterium]|nr:hypothetical protein [Armatimonadota bacterium]